MSELEGALHEAAGRLSPAHVAALVAHPDAVYSALSVAADGLAGAEPVRVRAGEAAKRIAECTREGAPETLLTSHELAARLEYTPVA